jgi:hypothetical protein
MLNSGWPEVDEAGEDDAVRFDDMTPSGSSSARLIVLPWTTT